MKEKKKKQCYRCKASEMYSVLNLFRKAYGYAVKMYDLLLFLIAKYWSLFPDDTIEPQNLTLNTMSSSDVKILEMQVLFQS
jgi:hypothetical protein